MILFQLFVLAAINPCSWVMADGSATQTQTTKFDSDNASESSTNDINRVLQGGAPTKYPTWSPTKSPTRAPTATPTLPPVSLTVTPDSYMVFTSHGCWNNPVDDRALPFTATSGMMTLDECAKVCSDFGFLLFSIHGGGGGGSEPLYCRCGSNDKDVGTYDRYSLSFHCNCDPKNGPVGSADHAACVYRVYTPATEVPAQVAAVHGMACFVPAHTSNGARVAVVHCPSDSTQNERWEKMGEQIVHSSGKCLHLKKNGKNEVYLVLGSCMNEGSLLYNNQRFTYHGMCTDPNGCESTGMIGTGYEGTCDTDGICYDGVVWNRNYVPKELIVYFKTCAEVKEFDSAAKDGKYFLQPEGVDVPILVRCHNMAGTPTTDMISIINIQDVAMGPGVSGNINYYKDNVLQPNYWYNGPVSTCPDTLCSKYVTSDLGYLYDVTEINIWNYYLGGRSYYSQKLEISQTGEFAGEQTILFDTGSGGIGPKETSYGNKHEFLSPVRTRYIRYHSGRSTTNDGIHFIQMTVKGNSQPFTEAPTPTPIAASLVDMRGGGIFWEDTELFYASDSSIYFITQSPTLGCLTRHWWGGDYCTLSIPLKSDCGDVTGTFYGYNMFNNEKWEMSAGRRRSEVGHRLGIEFIVPSNPWFLDEANEGCEWVQEPPMHITVHRWHAPNAYAIIGEMNLQIMIDNEHLTTGVSIGGFGI